MIGYDKTSLQQTAVWVSTPNRQHAAEFGKSGIGNGGRCRGQYIFTATGNGTFDSSGTVTDFGDSIVKS